MTTEASRYREAAAAPREFDLEEDSPRLAPELFAGDTPEPLWGDWFRTLVEGANDLIYLHRMDGTLIYANRKLADVTGWRREEIVGKNILEFLASGYLRSALARRERLPANPEGHRYEVEVICRDGSRVPLEVHSTPVMVGGEMVAWQGIARDIRERRRAPARMAAVYETARQVVSLLNLEDVLSAIVRQAADITGAQSCSLWMLDEGRRELYCVPSGGSDTGTARIPVAADHPVARSLRERRAVNARVEPHPAGSADNALPHGTVSVACLPLERSEGAFGVLSLSYAHLYEPDPDELALLSTFASHAAAAIANARLFEAQRRKSQEAAAIGQIGMTSGSLDVDSVLQVAGAYVYDLFAADLTVLLVLESGGVLRPAFAARRERVITDDRLGDRIALGEHPLLVKAVQEKRTLLSEDLASDPLVAGDELLAQMGLATALVVPLMSRDRAMGVLVTAYAAPTTLSDVQVRLAETLAQQAAVAMDNARMFRAIAAAKREWEATFDAITDAVCIFDTDGILTRANLAAGRLFAGGAGSLIGRHYTEIIYGDRVPEGGDVFAECLSLGQPASREAENLAVPGVFQIAGYPILDDTGKCTGVVEYIKDVTVQNTLQARLYESARLAGVGELASGVVHNFKNVLMGVSGMLDLAGVLLERGASREDVQARLTDAQEHVFRGNGVLQRLLDFARGRPQEVTDLSLDALVADVVALCRAHPASRAGRILVELPPDLPRLRADANQLHEVLMNLVLNGLQALSPHGVVKVTAGTSDGQVGISVADNGCGIPAEDLARIFEPFFTRRRNGPPGTGLGLAASQRMVRAMSGDIAVSSRVGEGTVFTVWLPIAPAAE